MRIHARWLVILVIATAAAALAQEWELGVLGGFGFPRNQTVSSPAGSGKAGFRPGAGAGVVGGHNMYERLGGEIRYAWRASDLKVSGAGQTANFNGESHYVHYDLLFHATDRDARWRPFVAGGGGIRVYRGTGVESAYQPAARFALLTKTQEVTALISVGGGVKIGLTDATYLRVEVRDYITPFPKQVVAPAPGAEIKGWLHELAPTIGFGFRF